LRKLEIKKNERTKKITEGFEMGEDSEREEAVLVI